MTMSEYLTVLGVFLRLTSAFERQEVCLDVRNPVFVGGLSHDD